MQLHALPHHGNFSLVGMFLGVTVFPTALIGLLFLLAHFI
jgi:hypothetical protein